VRLRQLGKSFRLYRECSGKRLELSAFVFWLCSTAIISQEARLGNAFQQFLWWL